MTARLIAWVTKQMVTLSAEIGNPEGRQVYEGKIRSMLELEFEERGGTSPGRGPQAGVCLSLPLLGEICAEDGDLRGMSLEATEAGGTSLCPSGSSRLQGIEHTPKGT